MADITSNLVAWYRLDETSGTTATDSSGNGNDGTYVNSPTLNVTGAFGTSTAVTFLSTSSQRVTLPNDLLAGATAVSCGFWLKLTAATFRTVASISYSYPNSGIVIRTSNAAATISVFTDNGSETETKSVTTLSTGTWYHVCVVCDGTTVIYIDGVSDKTQASRPFSISSGIASYIGAMNTTNYMSGTLDDVRFYSRALSSDDVSALYAYTGSVGPLIGPGRLTNFGGRLIRN